MVNWMRKVVLLGGLAVTVAPVWGPPAAAAEPQPLVLSGLVERLPNTPDARGEWRIAGLAVIVGPETRLKEDIANIKTDGYWTQMGTGIVVLAPGWSPDAAHLAGFRPAWPREVGGIALGLLVEAKVRPADGGVLRAIEITRRDSPSGSAPR